jgi:hypothetical protein
LVQAKYRTGLLFLSWDNTHDVMFELVDGDWRMTPRK